MAATPGSQTRSESPVERRMLTRLNIYMRTAVCQFSAGPTQGGDCPVCDDSLVVTDDPIYARLVRLPCGHEYHKRCLSDWWLTEGEEVPLGYELKDEPDIVFHEINPYALYCKECELRFTPNETAWARRDEYVPAEFGKRIVRYLKVEGVHLTAKRAYQRKNNFTVTELPTTENGLTGSEDADQVILKALNERAGMTINPRVLADQVYASLLKTAEQGGYHPTPHDREEYLDGVETAVKASMRKFRWLAVLDEDIWTEELNKAAEFAGLVVEENGRWTRLKR